MSREHDHLSVAVGAAKEQECDDSLGMVKALLEAALRVALDGHEAP
ncbi:MAG TPA: hypothetical protein VEU74_03500 [Gemmatimonadales bacterium]|nr:hypothetical protein [Gemmatimonadales bacterium]